MLYKNLEQSIDIVLEGIDSCNSSLIWEGTQAFDKGYDALLNASKQFVSLIEKANSTKLEKLMNMAGDVVKDIEKINPDKVPTEFSFASAAELQGSVDTGSKSVSKLSLAASRLNCLVGGTKDAIIELSKLLEKSEKINVDSKGIRFAGGGVTDEELAASVSELFGKEAEAGSTYDSALKLLVSATPDPKIQGTVKEDEGGFFKNLFGSNKESYQTTKSQADAILGKSANKAKIGIFSLTIEELDELTKGLIQMSGGIVDAAVDAVEGVNDQGEEIMQPNENQEDFLEQLKKHLNSDDDEFVMQVAAHIAGMTDDPQDPDPSTIDEFEFEKALKKHLEPEEVEELADNLGVPSRE